MPPPSTPSPPLSRRSRIARGHQATVGVGIPGTLSPATGLVKNANSVWLIGKPLLQDLRARLRRDVRIANDANCFAVSEAADGAAAGADVVFGVIIGTGTGAGIVIRGQVLVGLHAIAGEWGHNPLPWPDDDERPGPACYCGRRGCIETFLSGPGMSADHARRAGRHDTPPDIEAAAARGDAKADATLQRYESRLARGLASVINVLDPDVIVLGGGMSKIERLYENVPRLWSDHVFACGASLDRSRAGPKGLTRAGRQRGRAWCGRATVTPAACAVPPGSGRQTRISKVVSTLNHAHRDRLHRWLPASILALRHYSVRTFTSDLIAGVTVGLVALPLAMAFAISSGMSPQAGIYCAIVTGFLISALGGSFVQIGGPTGAFVVVVSGIIATYGIDGLFMCTMMAGVLLVVMGLTGTGTAVRYIPRPVVIGFTNGIALVIASTQLKDFFGITLAGPVPGEFLERMAVLAENAGAASPVTAAVAASVLALILVWNRLVPRVPGYVVALVAGTVAVGALHLPLETVGTRFGGIPSTLPEIRFPDFRADLILTLLSPTLTIAMLGAIESLLSAVVSDRMTGTRHNSNVELFAQGVANIASPLVGGLPATGAIARTATNVRSGARTPVAGMIHSLTLLAILLFASPLAAAIPMAVLAAILMVVAYNMGEWREIPELWKVGWTDRAVWMATFALTVLADLTVAVEAGMILAALLFIRRVTVTTTVSRVTRDYIDRGRAHTLQDKIIPDYVTIFRIHGPFLFGATDKLTSLRAQVEELTPVVVLRLRNMTAIDATGLHAIQDFADALRQSGRTLLLCGAPPQPTRMMAKAEFHRHVGEQNMLPNVEAALERAEEIWRGR